jgi:hypothetical protein
MQQNSPLEAVPTPGTWAWRKYQENRRVWKPDLHILGVEKCRAGFHTCRPLQVDHSERMLSVGYGNPTYIYWGLRNVGQVSIPAALCKLTILRGAVGVTK